MDTFKDYFVGYQCCYKKMHDKWILQYEIDIALGCQYFCNKQRLNPITATGAIQFDAYIQCQ